MAPRRLRASDAEIDRTVPRVFSSCAVRLRQRIQYSQQAEATFLPHRQLAQFPEYPLEFAHSPPPPGVDAQTMTTHCSLIGGLQRAGCSFQAAIHQIWFRLDTVEKACCLRHSPRKQRCRCRCLPWRGTSQPACGLLLTLGPLPIVRTFVAGFASRFRFWLHADESEMTLRRLTCLKA